MSVSMKDPPMDALSAHEEELVEQLRQAVAPLVEKHAHLKVFCKNKHTYMRYLRARSWNLAKATKMLMDTLHWRIEYQPHMIRWDDIKHEAKTGKHWVYPAKDKCGRPIVMMRPRLEDTKTHDTQIKFLIYDLEMASKIADDTGVGKMCWLLDFEKYSMSNAPPLKVSMHCNHILQNHYPERLGLAVCYHAPMLFSITWKATQPFIDKVTQQKIMFIDKGPKEEEQMNARFAMDEMEVCVGGKREGQVYSMAEYEKTCRMFDEETSAELQAMQASMESVATKLGQMQVSEGTHGTVSLEARA